MRGEVERFAYGELVEGTAILRHIADISWHKQGIAGDVFSKEGDVAGATAYQVHHLARGCGFSCSVVPPAAEYLACLDLYCNVFIVRVLLSWIRLQQMLDVVTPILHACP